MTGESENVTAPRQATLFEALVPVVALIFFLGWSLGILGFEDPHIPLILGSAVAVGMGKRLGWSWREMNKGMVDGISLGMPAILILLAIGILIGLWVAGGIVPLLIDLGLNLLSPRYFLPATCIICAVVSVTTGSSWTTAGTVGIALIGVGRGLGVPVEMTAGAIISGAYFGDKMSPLSDTTNLAPAVAGSELFSHIRHMMWTTFPSIVLAIGIYTLMGISGDARAAVNEDNLRQLIRVLEAHYELTPWLLVAPALIVVMVLKKVPALPALLTGAAAGGIMGMITQDMTLLNVLEAAMNGHTSETGIEAADDLLTRGGISSMYWTVTLILCALAFGGVMEKTGLLEVIATGILKLARSTGSLVATTIFTCIGMNIVAPDQYLSLVVPGRMYRNAFARLKLHPKNLSRVLEDAGTLTSPLIIWNTCGATMFEVLGVSAFLYWKYCYFNLINPVVSIIYGFTGFTMVKVKDDAESGNTESN